MLLIKSLRETAQSLKLKIENDDQLIEMNHIRNDSRKISTNDVYIAIVGDRLDGHQFIDDEMLKNVSFLVSQQELNTETAHIVVNNSISFIQEWAKVYRNMHQAHFIGLTGTNGKTSTKEMLSHILSQQYQTYATPGNFNNHIGLPLSLLNMRENAEVGVFEIGTNHPGEIAFLTKILNPDSALITNIGFGHMQNFIDFQALVAEKTDLFRTSRPDTTLFINMNDDELSLYSSAQRAIKFGVDIEADVRIESLVESEFKQCGKFDGQLFEIPLLGKHHLQNAAASIAIAQFLKMDSTKIIKSMSGLEAVPGRMQLIEIDDFLVIHDAYNANPVSMKSALDSISKLNENREKIVVLADMLELGEESLLKHQEIIDYAEDLDINHIVTFGNEMKQTKRNRSQHFEQIEDIVKWIQSTFKSAIILLKGSRGMALERIIGGLKQVDLSRGVLPC